MHLYILQRGSIFGTYVSYLMHTIHRCAQIWWNTFVYVYMYIWYPHTSIYTAARVDIWIWMKRLSLRLQHTPLPLSPQRFDLYVYICVCIHIYVYVSVCMNGDACSIPRSLSATKASTYTWKDASLQRDMTHSAHDSCVTWRILHTKRQSLRLQHTPLPPSHLQRTPLSLGQREQHTPLPLSQNQILSHSQSVSHRSSLMRIFRISFRVTRNLWDTESDFEWLESWFWRYALKKICETRISSDHRFRFVCEMTHHSRVARLIPHATHVWHASFWIQLGCDIPHSSFDSCVCDMTPSSYESCVTWCITHVWHDSFRIWLMCERRSSRMQRRRHIHVHSV